jgi:hypothetical protein
MKRSVIPTESRMGIFQVLRNCLARSPITKAFSGFGLPRLQPSIWADRVGVGVSLDPSDVEPPATCPWSDITAIVVFKRNLFAVDLLCLRFELESGEALEVNEKMGGWSHLLEKLHDFLPGCMTKSQVLEAIVKPAFATNETRVYSRPWPPAV